MDSSVKMLCPLKIDVNDWSLRKIHMFHIIQVDKSQGRGKREGSSTKLAVQIINVKKGQSADSTDLFALLEVTDNDDNMHFIFNIYGSL